MDETTGADTLTCPFPDCGWSYEYEPNLVDELSLDYKRERHYEREHAGRVKIHVKLETTQLLGDRDLQDISDRYHDKMADKLPPSMDLSWTAAEEIEPADNHEVLQDNE